MNTTEELDLLNDEPVFPEHETGTTRRLDYLGYAPCPIRSELRKGLHRHFDAERRRTGLDSAWFMSTGCGDSDPYDEIWRTENVAELPALISEGGIADIFRPEFVRRWIDTGVCGALPVPPVRSEFREAGMVDPLGIYHVYGVFPHVILADLKKLGDRPLPASWADLLHPRYRNDVVIGGEEGDISVVLLYNFHKEFGEEGLAALGANVRDFWSGAQMAKTAGTENPNGAALYVLPWFFAMSNPRRERTALIWPAEGVLAMPLYVIGQRELTPAARVALTFLTGPEWAAHMAKVGFPPSATYGKATPALPGKLKWLGWDYMRTHDLAALRDLLNAAFMKGRGA